MSPIESPRAAMAVTSFAAGVPLNAQRYNGSCGADTLRHIADGVVSTKKSVEHTGAAKCAIHDPTQRRTPGGGERRAEGEDTSMHTAATARAGTKVSEVLLCLEAAVYDTSAPSTPQYALVKLSCGTWATLSTRRSFREPQPCADRHIVAVIGNKHRCGAVRKGAPSALRCTSTRR